jgi:hypothetical protein
MRYNEKTYKEATQKQKQVLSSNSQYELYALDRHGFLS